MNNTENDIELFSIASRIQTLLHSFIIAFLDSERTIKRGIGGRKGGRGERDGGVYELTSCV